MMQDPTQTAPDFNSYASSLGTISQDYNGTFDQTHGITFGDKRQTHEAYDIANPAEPMIKPFVPGKVIKTVTGNTGYGNEIVVQGVDGREYIYGHFKSLNVKQGQDVSAEDILGQMGSTGNSTGPHVHFEVHDKSGKVVDPKTMEQIYGGSTKVVTQPTTFDKMDLYTKMYLLNILNPEQAI